MNCLAKTREDAVTKRSLTLPVLVSLGLLVVGAGCGSQRRVACAPRADDFAIKLTFVKGSKTGTGSCDTRFDGPESIQKMGMQPYFNAPGAPNQINSLAIQPFETGVYATSAPLADPVGMDSVATHKAYAVGKFTSQFADNQDICHVTMLSAAEVQYDMAFMIPPAKGGDDGGATDDGGDDGGATDAGGADAAGSDALVHTAAAALVDAGVDGDASVDGDAGVDGDASEGGVADAGGSQDSGGSSKDAGAADGEDAMDGGDNGGMCTPPGDPDPPTMFDPLHVKYDFSNLQLYVTAALTGSMVAGDLTYTQFNGATTCTAKYTFTGLSPFVRCCVSVPKDPSTDSCLGDDTGIPQPSSPTDKGGIHTACDQESQVCALSAEDPRGFVK